MYSLLMPTLKLESRMKTINYSIKQGCFDTPCPAEKRIMNKGNIIGVASAWCEDCEHYEGTCVKEQWIKCSWEEE